MSMSSTVTGPVYFFSKKSAFTDGFTLIFSSVHSSDGAPSAERLMRLGSFTPSTVA